MMKLQLPCSAEHLVPHRPPMLLLARLTARDRQADTATAEAFLPDHGFWLAADHSLLPEYLIELMAQAMAAVNGYDAMLDGRIPARGFLVGVDDFHWLQTPRPGERVRVTLQKNFAFGMVTIMAAAVFGEQGELGRGALRVWEEEHNGETI